MKFPYTPISYITADVKAELKQMDQAGDILEGDMINYIIECIREIGGHNYEMKPAIVQINNNNGPLPKDFYLIDRIYVIDTAPVNITKYGSIWFVHEGTTYYPQSILYPGDVMTGTRYSTSHMHCKLPQETPTYIIRAGQIRTGFSKATLGLHYLALPTAEDGGFMMQDEIYSIKAAKAFCMMKLLQEKYYMGQLTQNIWNDIKGDYTKNVDMAQAVFKFPDPADDVSRGIEQNHRYDAFKLR